jgi:hypothetical protein
MDIMSLAVLILLCLVGYSAGATARAGKTEHLKPNIADLIFVSVIWATAIYSRGAFDLKGWILIILWVVISAMVGMVVKSFRKGRETIASPKEQSEKGSSGLFSSLWSSWKGFSKRMGGFQSRIILSLFFFVFFSLFAMIAKILSDPLKIKEISVDTFWMNRKEPSTDIEEFRRQF